MSQSEYSRKVEVLFHTWLGKRRISSDSDYFNGLEEGFSAGYGVAQPEPTYPEPDIYEVLLIGGGNDGKRIAVPKEYIHRYFEQTRLLEIPYAPDSEILSFEDMVRFTPRETKYVIERYHPVRLYDNLIVGRHEDLPLCRMYIQLARKYRRDLQQTT